MSALWQNIDYWTSSTSKLLDYEGLWIQSFSENMALRIIQLEEVKFTDCHIAKTQWEHYDKYALMHMNITSCL